MHDKKVLITGTTGMLGKHFVELFSNRYNVYTLNRNDGNLFDFEFVNNFVSSLEPDIIVHCIADTNLSRCEKNKENTLMLHCGLTDCLSSFKSRFIYISSDSCKEPLDFYAKTKWLGEKITCLNNKNSVILRTNIYGFNSSGGNSLVEWAIKNFKTNKTIKGFSDIIFNAIYTKQLVEVTDRIINSNFTGHLDVGGNYQISKFNFLKKLSNLFGYGNLVKSSTSSELDTDIKRPKNTILDVEKLKDKFDISLSLEEGLKKLKQDMEIK